jgi:nucleoside phosphorylase
MTRILRRITYLPERAELAEIPWPAGLAPRETATALAAGGSLPLADVLVITWTAAEAQTLADVLTPGAPWKSWTHYAKDFAAYETQLTSRSPAKEARRLGEFHMAAIGDHTVCCYHSQLHPATDGPTLPAAQLAAQIAGDTGAGLVITTGTAGGAGTDVVLGDLNVATAIHADCTTRLKGHPWSNEEWATTALTAGQQEMLGSGVLPALLAANAGRLPAEYAPRPPQAWYGHTVGTDLFAYWTANGEPFALSAYDPAIKTVEMDDFAIALGISTMDTPPRLSSVRNASDPPLATGSKANLKLAEEIYEKWGGLTTVSSAIGTWALIAGLVPATRF